MALNVLFKCQFPLVFKCKQLKCTKALKKTYIHSPMMNFMKLAIMKHDKKYVKMKERERHLPDYCL